MQQPPQQSLGFWERTRGEISRHQDAVALSLLLVIGLWLRFAFAFRAPVFLVHDSVTYFQAGFDFARGLGFDLAFKRTPLYPLFIAGVVALVSEDLQAVGFVQHLLGGVTIVLGYLLGRDLFGRAAGFLAGLLLALHGPLVIFEHYVLAEPLFIPLLLAFALAVVKGVRQGSRGWLLLAGVLLGLASLSRPVGQAVVIAVPPALLLAFRSWRRAGIGTLCLLIGVGLVILPWMIRNYVQNGSFESAGAIGQSLVGRIIRHDEGFVLPRPESPSPYSDPVRTEARALILRQMARDARPSAINHRVRNTFAWTEAEANRAMGEVAREIINSQREHYVFGTFAKFRQLLWGEREEFLATHWASRKNNELREDWISNATIAHLLTPPSPQQEAEKLEAMALVEIFSPYALRWPLLLLLGVGVIAGLRQRERWAAAFLLLLVLALTAPAAALVGYVPRYRYPADPFLAVLIGYGTVVLATLVATWLQRLRRGSSTRLTVGLSSQPAPERAP